MPTVNLVAVVVATIVDILIGALWYSPLLFGKIWHTLMSQSNRKHSHFFSKEINFIYFVNIIASFIMIFILAHVIAYMKSDAVITGVVIGFWAWCGFVMTSTMPTYLFEHRSHKLFLIYNGYKLFSLMIVGGILAIW